MFKSIGKKLVQGAKAEINEKPVQLFDKDALEGAAEMLVGVGLLAIGIGLLLRRPKAETVVHVTNNYYMTDH